MKTSEQLRKMTMDQPGQVTRPYPPTDPPTHTEGSQPLTHKGLGVRPGVLQAGEAPEEALRLEQVVAEDHRLELLLLVLLQRHEGARGRVEEVLCFGVSVGRAWKDTPQHSIPSSPPTPTRTSICRSVSVTGASPASCRASRLPLKAPLSAIRSRRRAACCGEWW